MITADFYTLSNNENHLCFFSRVLVLPPLAPRTVLIPELEPKALKSTPRTHQSSCRVRHFVGTQLPHRIYLFLVAALFSPIINYSAEFIPIQLDCKGRFN